MQYSFRCDRLQQIIIPTLPTPFVPSTSTILLHMFWLIRTVVCTVLFSVLVTATDCQFIENVRKRSGWTNAKEINARDEEE